MTFNLVDSQVLIKEYLEANLNWDVYTGGIEEAQTLSATQGVLRPHVVLRFGSAQPDLADQSFAGPRYDGQHTTMDALCVAAYDLDARKLSSKVADVLVGYRPDVNSSQLKLDWGGGTFTVISEGSKPQFYIAWVSFRFSTNLVQ